MTTSTPATAPTRDRSRLRAAAKILVFDTAGPLVAYWMLRSAGLSAVSALVLSGVLPGIAVLGGLVRHRRLDAIGVLVLAGIAVGTVLGLLTGSARLVLVEGSVPTAVFGLLCLGSLRSRRPLIFRFALEFMGADTPRGRDFDRLWQYPGFRHAFWLFTVIWGVAYLAEAAARIVIVETTSTGTALAVSKVMPYAVAGILSAWMTLYGRRTRRRGERLAAAAQTAAAQTAAAQTAAAQTAAAQTAAAQTAAAQTAAARTAAARTAAARTAAARIAAPAPALSAS
jgi:tryptophan-rich sensory protein